MSNHSIIVWLLPIVFMIHDFEEIVFFKVWIDKNKGYLEERFPRLSKLFIRRVGSLSTPAFTVAVAEEFVLLSAITLASALWGCYALWLAAFMGFFVHLLMHLGQWVILRRYIPALFTTLLVLPYCIYTLYIIRMNGIFSLSEIALWTIIGFGLLAVNLIFAHKLAELFNKNLKNAK